MALLQIMVVTGEVSGDRHAADLVTELRRRLPDARFFGMGGARLAEKGVELIYSASEISVMGITEVLPKLRRIARVLNGLDRSAANRRPRCAILVDIPDFNLRLARRLKRLQIPVAYYVSPKIWAWRRGRIETIAGRVDEMLCILPFEEAIYRRAGVRARYVGNPVLDQLPAPAEMKVFREKLGLDPQRTTLALLPGSRITEIRRILPAMVGAARELSAEQPGLQILVPIAPGVPAEEIRSPFAGSGLEPVLVAGQAPEAVGASDAAVVASGTAVLEAGLMQRPFVVVYRVSALSYLVGRLLLRVRHIGLVNLLLERRLVPELIQGAMTPRRIAAEVRRIWIPGPDRDRILSGLKELRAKLGPAGAASRAADEIVSLLRA